MNIKTTILTAVLAGGVALLSSSAKAVMQETKNSDIGTKTEIVLSEGIVDLLESISSEADGEKTFFHYRNWGDTSHIGIDTIDNPLFGKGSRVQVTAYDANNDGKIDGIELYRNSTGENSTGSKDDYASQWFYRGPVLLDSFAKTFGQKIEKLEEKTISNNEIGMVQFESRYKPLTFVPIESEDITKAFGVFDKMYKEILPIVSESLMDLAKEHTIVPDFGSKYHNEIKFLMNLKPEANDYK